MNERLFLDTSGLLCLHDIDDFRHEPAIRYVQAARELVTTNYVLTEFVPLSQVRGHDRQESLVFLADLLLVPRLDMAWVDADLHQRAMELLASRLDKTYSLCDAVSFLIMRERGFLAALTTDKHFEQEGFVRLLEN